MLACTACRKVIVDDAQTHCQRCGASLAGANARIELTATGAAVRGRMRRVNDALVIGSAALAGGAVVLPFGGDGAEAMQTGGLIALAAAFLRFIYAGWFLGAVLVAFPPMLLVGFSPFVLLAHLCLGAALDWWQADLHER